jgi:hypothetical protein
MTHLTKNLKRCKKPRRRSDFRRATARKKCQKALTAALADYVKDSIVPAATRGLLRGE